MGYLDYFLCFRYIYTHIKSYRSAEFIWNIPTNENDKDQDIMTKK